MAAVAVAVVLAAAGADAAQPLTSLRGVVHVHSDLTTGDFSLEALVGLAEAQGIGALLLAENYRLRVDYGLPPFRALTRVTREERSVADRLERYLERVAAVRARLPHVLLVAGVEVMPHYHWTGSPLSGELTVHNTQKNLLVFGLADPAALRALPVVGNASGGYTLQSLLDVLPVILLVPGLVLLARPRVARRRLGHTVIVVRRRAWLRGAVLCVVAAAALVRGWPFRADAYPPWQDFGIAPHQAIIDRVDALGGVSVWSFPEARDAGERPVGPVRVTWTTAPYSDDLLRTFRYTAFGAVYEDTTAFERPGGGWDRLLTEYARGERSRPAWGIAESGFHGLSGGKQVGPVQTVFLVTERSEAGVLDAFRRGRLYAMHRTGPVGLDLADLSLRAGAASAISGEALRAAAGTPVELHVGVEASDRGRHDVRVTLVRNGAVVDAWTGATPLRAVHRATADGAPAVFRVEARGAGARLLSNPVFLRP